MKILHDLVPCGICGVFNVKVLDLNGLWLCASCLANANQLMNDEPEEVATDEVTTEWAC